MSDITLLQGDCLERMREIEDGSIDLVLCDLPYGTTDLTWDVVIPFRPLWEHYKRLLKPAGAVVLTASQPFTSMLLASNPKWFKYELVWDKRVCSAPGVAAFRPLPAHESVLVFANGRTTFNPQMEERSDEELRRLSHQSATRPSTTEHFARLNTRSVNRTDNQSKHPSSVIRINGIMNRSGEKTSHPTQKPVALMEYLIRTYSNPGDIVLDNCAGSGTTLVACLNTGRRGIGIELNPDYFAMAEQRIADARLRLDRPHAPPLRLRDGRARASLPGQRSLFDSQEMAG